MPLPTSADQVVIQGYLYDEDGGGLQQPVSAAPVALTGQSPAPMLLNTVAHAHIQTKTRTTIPDSATGYWAILAVATNDPDVDAYGGRAVTLPGQPARTVEVPYTAPQQQVTTAMAAQINPGNSANLPKAGDTVRVAWFHELAGYTAPTPTVAYYTTGQTASVVATAVQSHDQDASAHAALRARLAALEAASGGASPLEGAPLYVYGHSYHDDIYGSGTGAGGAWTSRLAVRRQMLVTKRSIGGQRMTGAARYALSGSTAWTPGARGLVTLCCTINDVRAAGSDASAVRSYQHSLRAFLSAVRSKYRAVSASTDFVFSAGWSSSTTQAVLTTARWQTTTIGSYAEVNVTGAAADLLLTLRSTGGGVCTVASDGVTVATVDHTAALGTDYTPTAVALSGLGAGTHRIRVTLTSGSWLGIDGLFIPSETPPTVLFMAEGPVGAANNNSDLTGTWIPAAQSVLAGYPNAVYARPDSGWSATAMLREDQLHPNDRGASYLASTATAALSGVGFHNGLNVLTTAPTYNTPSAPSTPAGGQTGLGSTGVIASDDFNRADSSTLGVTPVGGYAWTKVPVGGGAGGGAWAIASSQLAVTGGQDEVLVVNDAVADGTVTATMVNLGDTGLVFRCVDGGNFWLLWNGAATYRLMRYASGGYTQVGSSSSTAPAAGDVLSVTLAGSSITCKVNGATVVTATDSTFATATRHGVRNGPNAPGDVFDNFSHTTA